MPDTVVDAELARRIQSVLDGPYAAARDECRGLDPAVFGAPDEPLPMDEHRARVSDQIARLADTAYAAKGFPTAQGGLGDTGASVAAYEMLAYADISLFVKAGVQWGLFGGAVSNLGTARHHELVPDIIDGRLQGCFAMTETGHGSDVQHLGTTATYDPGTRELVIDTPTPAARKDYIGNAARDARVAAVFARLHTPDGDAVDPAGHGVHCVLVPIRDEAGAALPGVTITDCGPKMGLTGVDNGRLSFDHVRVPVTNLLDRYGDIDADGHYTSPIESVSRRFFTMLGTLVRGRVSVAGGAIAATRAALTIATRYAAARRQFTRPGTDGDTGGAPETEVPILAYRTHQRRLLPAIARAYALTFAQNDLVAMLDEVQGRPPVTQSAAAEHEGVTDDVDAEREQAQRRLESLAAGIKAVATANATATIQMCREACGGAGYLWANRLAALKADTDVFSTFEGDNTVLLQLVAKSLLTQFADNFNELDAVGIARWGVRSAVETVVERTQARALWQRATGDEPAWRSVTTQLRMLADREEHMLDGLARRLRRAQDDDADGFAVFNDAQDHLVATARAHVDLVVLESFVEAIRACEDEDVAARLEVVCDLYALSTIEEHRAWFLEHDRLTPARAKTLTATVNELCAQLAPHALTLVAGFGIPDGWLRTEMLDDAR